MIFNSPYPHIKEDNFLNNNLLDKIKYFWPDNNLFFDEISGIRLLDLHYSTNTETRLKKIKKLSGRYEKTIWGSTNFWERFIIKSN